jgi:hypothetical protein
MESTSDKLKRLVNLLEANFMLNRWEVAGELLVIARALVRERVASLFDKT